MAQERKKRIQSEAEGALFAPPTDDEIRESTDAEMFAPPSESELDEVGGGTVSALSSFLNEMMLGNLPALEGAAAALVPTDDRSMKDRYVEERDKAARTYATAQSKSPKLAQAGQAAGIGAGLLGGYGASKVSEKVLRKVFGPAADTVMGAIRRGAADAAITGAVVGAAQEPGTIEGEFDPAGDLKKRLQAGGLGALIAAPIGGAGGAIARTLNVPFRMAQNDLAEREAAIMAATPRAEMAAAESLLGASQKSREAVINSAGKQLGIVPTTGMKSADPTKRFLEDSLSESPSGIGKMVSQKLRGVKSQLSTATGNLLKDRSADLNYQFDVGSRIKEQLGSSLNNIYKPIKEAYAQLAPDLNAVKVDRASKARVMKFWGDRIDNSGLFLNGSPRKALADSFLQQLPRMESAAQLENMSNAIGQQIRALAKSGGYDPMLGEIQSAVDRLSQRSILKSAIANTGNHKSGKTARDLAVKMFSDMRAVDKEYGALKKVLEQTRGVTKMSGPATMGTILDDLSEMPAEQLARAMFDPKNIAGLKFIQKQFPEVAKDLRGYKLREIADKSMTEAQGEITAFMDPKAFFRQVDGMPPYMKDFLFGSNVKKLDPLKTLSLAIPGKAGPSGTPRGMDFLDILNPMKNVRDIARWGMLNNDKNASVMSLSNVMDMTKVPNRVDRSISHGSGALAGASVAGVGSSSTRFQERPRIEGFRAEEVMPIDPALMPEYLKSIDKDSTLDNIQKAKLKNLAHKHGLAPVGR